jgi:hypothetical protein
LPDEEAVGFDDGDDVEDDKGGGFEGGEFLWDDLWGALEDASISDPEDEDPPPLTIKNPTTENSITTTNTMAPTVRMVEESDIVFTIFCRRCYK